MNDEAEMTTRKKNRDVGEWSKTTTHMQASSRPVGGGDPLFVFFALAENDTAGSRIEIYKDSAWPVRMQLSMCMYKHESMRRCGCVYVQSYTPMTTAMCHVQQATAMACSNTGLVAWRHRSHATK